MSRQLRTLLTGAALCLLLGILSFGLRVPYVVLSPGPTINTLGQQDGKDIIVIKGYPVAKTSGQLRLTTVSVDTRNTTVLGAMRGWLASDQVVVPHDSIYPPGKSEEQVNEEDKKDFTESQDFATAAAACELGYPRGIKVGSVNPDSPNGAVLKVDDRFVSLNGVPITSDASLRKVLSTLKQGSKVPGVINRGERNVTVSLTLGAPDAAGGLPRIGISLIEGCLPPFKVTLGLPGIGGPSAGLMFSLGILDKIGKDNLTHGKVVAGTGTIDASGKVGEIGGIQLKMLGARRAGATIFLAPTGNCPDVRSSIPKGLTVVKVPTLHDAITSLDSLANGGTAPHC
jgi:PDZ domain-containing protein